MHSVAICFPPRHHSCQGDDAEGWCLVSYSPGIPAARTRGLLRFKRSSARAKRGSWACRVNDLLPHPGQAPRTPKHRGPWGLPCSSEEPRWSFPPGAATSAPRWPLQVRLSPKCSPSGGRKARWARCVAQRTWTTEIPGKQRRCKLFGWNWPFASPLSLLCPQTCGFQWCGFTLGLPPFKPNKDTGEFWLLSHTSRVWWSQSLRGSGFGTPQPSPPCEGAPNRRHSLLLHLISLTFLHFNFSHEKRNTHIT